MWERYPPTPPFHRGENEIQASLISSASVGATPTPATNLREVIRPAACKSAVTKQRWKMTTGALPALPTSLSKAGQFGLVAQPAERPVVCGRIEGATPFGSAILSERSSVFRAPGLGPGGRRWKSCRSDHFKLLPWPNTSGIRLLSGTMQVEILPAAPLPGGVKVARRPVKPFGVGASPTLAANFWKAGRYKLAAPVLKTGSASPRSEHYRRLPPLSRSSKAEHPADNRENAEHYRAGRPI